MKYIHLKEYNENRLLEILKLDEIVYKKEFTGTLKSVSERYKKNTKMFILAIDDNDKICGYICFFPISNKLTLEIEKKDMLFDDNITKDDVKPYNKKKINNIFIISIVVYPKYQKMSIGSSLMKEMFLYLDSLSITGYKFGSLYATITSIDGKRLFSKFNFKNIHNYDNNNSLFKYKYNIRK